MLIYYNNSGYSFKIFLLFFLKKKKKKKKKELKIKSI